ncbi:tafazzin homolog isoform X2 [Drosophila subobscura]|uniref:tafazzin homolog isoform X2 n=2 Tax=Drosophila subobscura TaxID=7241 RepID=UPI00155A0AFD|nr:tafazzin homolog isoform X2 [Drosophila subobscura]
MLMAVCANLCRYRHVQSAAACATRSLYWGRIHLPLANGLHPSIFALSARQYVQAPETRPVPDERSTAGLQKQEQTEPRPATSRHPVSQQALSSQPIQTQPPPPQPPTMSDKEPRMNMPTDVVIPYNIDWVFERMRCPSRVWWLASHFVIAAVGIFSKILLMIVNKTRVYNKELLVDLISKRPKGVGLLTVSNHYSCLDDPCLWGMLPLRQACNTSCVRWSMAAHDICFTNMYHSMFFMFGKCIPVVRGYGVYQEAINLCIEKCATGQWVHVFPEGKVNMEKEELRLKWGVGRIIYDSPKVPIILPLWHEGMDDVLPNVEPYVPQWRKKVTINIGQPLDLNDFVQDLKNKQVPEQTARKLITDKIQEVFRILRTETEQLHRERQ